MHGKPSHFIRKGFYPAHLGAILLICLAGAPTASAVFVHEHRLADGQPPASLSRDTEPGPLVAPLEACQLQESLTASAPQEVAAMLCMINYARTAASLASVNPVKSLTTSAEHKTEDLLTCEEFSHLACDRPFSYWIRATGYTSVPCWSIGEVLGYGRGRLGTARSTFIAWMRSPTHRHVILNDFAEVGVSEQVGNLGYYGQVRVWTGHFGVQC